MGIYCRRSYDPFDIEKAKGLGAPVCTRDGNEVLRVALDFHAQKGMKVMVGSWGCRLCKYKRIGFRVLCCLHSWEYIKRDQEFI